MKRVAIVGGGISGLSAAFYLERERRRGTEIEYTLYEAGPRLGGVMRTDRVEGCLVEAGPDSFLTEKPAASQLCRDLGIEDQLIGSNDERRKTFIVVGRRLIPIPDGLMFMVPTKIWPVLTTPLFSLGSKVRMAREWFAAARAADGDESVAAFVARHFGREMVERLADPLLAGVYGGEAARLSVRAVLPRFAEMEKNYGSLSRAMLAARRQGKTRHAPKRPLFSSLRDGMQQLVDTVSAQIDPKNVRLNMPVRRVERRGEKWQIATDSAAEAFDGLVIATPAYHAAKLIEASAPDLARQLAGIRYSSSVTVALGYDVAKLSARERRVLSEGFGFLVPFTEGKRMLASTFVHNKFPHRVPDGRMLLRVVLAGGDERSDDGGSVKSTLDLRDADILAIVGQELNEILGLVAEPLFTRVYRWPRAMAQYDVGHLEQVAQIRRLIDKLPSVALAGNAYSGIGVPDCIRTGAEAVTLVTRQPTTA